jgi:3-hydroxyacyl-CoA dehydrogenase
VEVIYDDVDSRGFAERLAAALAALGRKPLVLPDSPGFAVNSFLHPYLGAALQMLHEGTPWRQIEHAAVAGGTPWGPLTQLDEIGIDTAVRVAKNLPLLDSGDAATEILTRLLTDGALGKKTGRGLFNYYESDERTPTDYLESLAVNVGGQSQIDKASELSRIQKRLFAAFPAVASRLITAGILHSVAEAEEVLRDGLGFRGSAARIDLPAETELSRNTTVESPNRRA